MITDLEKIKKLGEINETENYRFRSYLKMQNPEKIDKIVHQLFINYSSKIDCTTCANCCIVLTTLITPRDLKRLTRSLKIPKDEFIKKFIKFDEDGGMILKDLPCKFLENKKCTIYPYRPYDCRSYPHLHKKEFTTRLLGVIDNYSVCPIVFNVYEDLKTRLRFK